jgi:hypothetical protein
MIEHQLTEGLAGRFFDGGFQLIVPIAIVAEGVARFKSIE